MCDCNMFSSRHTHWFHTIAIGRSDLDRAFDNNSMKKRTARFTVLAMSLAALLDVAHPNDLLRGLLNTLSEWEQNKDEGDRQRLVSLYLCGCYV